MSDEKFKSILFYAGTFEVDGNKVIHHVTNASDINRVGKDMIREVILENDKLILIAKGDFGLTTLSWRKINKD